MDHSDLEPTLEPTLGPTLDSHIGSQSEPPTEPTFDTTSGSDGDMSLGDDPNDDNMWMYIAITISGLFLTVRIIERIFYIHARRLQKWRLTELQTAKMVDHKSSHSKTNTGHTESE